jgi:drug/metabolite transporter (DMT)-like permease
MDKYQIKVIYPIVINYFVAFAFGILFTKPDFAAIKQDIRLVLPAAAVLGTFFIVMFYFIGFSAQKAGISVTSVASRMSLIIPMVFAIFFYNEPESCFKWAGILLAVPAVLLTSYKKEKANFEYWYLPLVIFIGSGLVDSIVVFSQRSLLRPETQNGFTIFVFGIAAILGLILSVLRNLKWRIFFQKNVLMGGALLGILNFGSLYFILLALKNASFDDSIVFGINNTGIVLLSVFVGFLFFKEKLSAHNWMGILLSLATIIILSLHS